MLDRNKRYTTVVFDLDGTLLDSIGDLTVAVNFALEQEGLPLCTEDEVLQYVGDGLWKLIRRAVPKETDEEKIESVFAVFKKYYTEHSMELTRPYDGIKDLLKELHARGYVIAIVSNKVDNLVKPMIRYYFGELVDYAVGESEGMPRKPEPDLVDHALAVIGSSREESVYVGDSTVDIRTAANAEMPCISVLWGFRSRDVLVKAGGDTFVETPCEILELLDADNQ